MIVSFISVFFCLYVLQHGNNAAIELLTESGPLFGFLVGVLGLIGCFTNRRIFFLKVLL